ncbi:hypothetical protein [Nocardia sp. NPDC050406]|uniref:hypothetical protein n=1 Tax=Nocardia sp. NPDC050406 TaxID=3364318 RepID=UPI0037B1BCBE
MTGTPPAQPNESDETPARAGAEHPPTRPGQHQNPEPPPHSASQELTPEHGRHEMPGPRGYPQFEGPGAAQYGSEPLEPPPPMPRQAPVSGSGMGAPPSYAPPPQSGAPQQDYGQASQQGYGEGARPGYGEAPQQGYGQGAAPGYGQAPQSGYGHAPQQGYEQSAPPGQAPQSGSFPQGGSTPRQSGGLPGAAPAGQRPPGGAPGDHDSLDVGHALAYGWDRFRLNPIPWAGIVLVGLIAYLVVTLLINIADVRSLPVVLLVFAIASLMVWLLQAAMIRGALYETDGTPADFPTFFGFVNAGNVLLTALMVFVACLIASIFCVVPAFLVGVLCMFALNFVIDQDQNPIEAIKSSARLVIANPFQVLLLALSIVVITVIGLLLCGLGLLVAGPVSAIAVTYAYRTLTGGLVAPL